MPIAELQAPKPARDFEEALARFEILRAADDAAVSPEAYSRFYSHLARTPLAVVLVHGFTNNPEQYSRLAPTLHARGHTVVIPRLPGHGDRDRSGRRLGHVRLADWLRTTDEAIDIACGAGERVVISGISVGGVLAAWAAVRRADIARAIPVAAFFGIIRLDLLANALLGRVLATLPNVDFPWDPFGDQSQIPPYAYPRFPTRGLGESLLLGTALVAHARAAPPAAREVVMVTNAHEPAIDNTLIDRAIAGWNASRARSARDYRFADLPSNHDIIDPTNPLQRIDIVYPKLIELIEGA